jgi:hypothetical protein
MQTIRHSSVMGRAGLSLLVLAGALTLCQCDSNRGAGDDKVDCASSIRDTLNSQFQLYFILQSSGGAIYGGPVKYTMERHPCGRASDGQVTDSTDLQGRHGRYIAPFTTYQFTNERDYVHIRLQAGTYVYTYDYWYDEVKQGTIPDPSVGTWYLEDVVYITMQ